MTTYKNNKKRTNKSISRMVIGTVLFIGLGAGSLYGIEKYNNPQLYGKWVSTETKEEIIFNENGTVTLNDIIYTPKFQVVSSNRMVYTVEEKTFETYYQLDGRSLQWGLSEKSMEQFKRK